MTIKQHGGVFGRNPTFNNITIDGTLSVDQIAEKTGAAGITLDGVTLKDGNVVLANGKGIDFSATAGTGTSELFDDYEEGTWTPVPTNVTVNSGTPVWSGTYTKIGRTVIARWGVTGGSINVSLSSYISLPFTSAETAWGAFGNASTNTFSGGVATYGSDLYFGTAASFAVASGTITFQV